MADEEMGFPARTGPGEPECPDRPCLAPTLVDPEHGASRCLTVARIREILEFLRTEYGCQEIRAHEEGMCTEVVWANDTTAIHVTRDVRAGLFLDLVKRGATSGRNSFGIEDIKRLGTYVEP